MKLKSARIKHFKRFVDLTIRNLPTDAKLVVLLGPNGCGKSSLFDAFQRSLKVDQFYGMSDELRRYYQRATSEGIAESDDVSLEFHGGNPTSEVDLKKSLYIRSAYRHEPSFQNTTFQQVGNVLDRQRSPPADRHGSDRTGQLSEDHLACHEEDDDTWVDDRWHQ